MPPSLRFARGHGCQNVILHFVQDSGVSVFCLNPVGVTTPLPPFVRGTSFARDCFVPRDCFVVPPRNGAYFGFVNRLNEVNRGMTLRVESPDQIGGRRYAVGTASPNFQYEPKRKRE